MKKRAIFVYFFSNLLDVCTTKLAGLRASSMETNRFARDAECHALIGRLIAIKLYFAAGLALLLLIAYWQLKEVSIWLADTLVVGILLWLSVDLLQVSLSNWLIYLGWCN
jgi:hypothetical protein